MAQKFLLLALFLSSYLQAEIIEVTHIDEIRPYVTQEALCLFDIDDTLICNPFSLGAPQWRSWVKPKLPKHADFVLYDALTLAIAKKAPYIAVEPTTAKLITDLQKEEIAVLGFTARGRSEWYSTTVEGVDRFTKAQLKQAGIDFSQTSEIFNSLNPIYYCSGIIFAKHTAKGELFSQLFQELSSFPLILFVDDKLENVQSMQAALKDKIPFVGIWYHRAETAFDPLVATVQLEYLLEKSEILNDEQAQALVLPGRDPEVYLKEIIKQLDPASIHPCID